MFSYYGTKARLADKYPRPLFDTIVEPFAGAAGYACSYPDYDVVLIDANPKIIAVWDFLIRATTRDIRALPDIAPGQSVNDFQYLTDAERWLIGFCINPASSTPKVTATKRSAWPRYKQRLVDFVPKIGHWTATVGTYSDDPDVMATWFVDPPYQAAGKYYYGHKGLDFTGLGLWCKRCRGQVIVCENEGADWLPFAPLTRHNGLSKQQVEVWWTNDRVAA